MSADIDRLFAAKRQGKAKARCLGDLLVMSDTQLRAFFKASSGSTDTETAGSATSWCEGIRALPLVDVSVEPDAMISSTDNVSAAGSKSKPKPKPKSGSKGNNKIDSLEGLLPLTQYSVVVNLKHLPAQTAFRPPRMIKEPGQAYTPRFGKIQYEGWWLVLAQDEELVAIKRVSMQGKPESSGVWANSGELAVKGSAQRRQGAGNESRSVKLMFITPETAGAYRLKLYLVSDAYLGLDQEIDVDTVVGAGQMTLAADSSFISKERMKEYQ
ncbi:activating signal cointegrator 1 complex subunit 3 [Coemansia sp. RSA 486]|nr:activating signal cointegrator 1 complex subunit 3 [Coemansia sp. RSA 486]